MTAAFTGFDLRNMLGVRTLLPLLFVAVFGATLPVPGLPIVIGALIASVTVSTPFQGDERGRLDTLYATAPLARRSVVVGRYLSTLVFALAAVLIGTVTTLVSAAVRHQAVSWPLIAVMLLVALVCICVTYAVQLPWFFALGFTRGRPMVYIPVAVIAVGGFLAGQSGMLTSASPAEIGLPPWPLAVGVGCAGIAALVVSGAVSDRLYRHREL
jgi:ABC-type transport system involved in multi-copper enzyme maturation permease subunit